MECLEILLVLYLLQRFAGGLVVLQFDDDGGMFVVLHDRDVNQWLIRERELADGSFSPRRPIKDSVYSIGQNASKMHACIRSQRIPMICQNDDGISSEQEFIKLKQLLNADFEAILPEKSSFEI